jgi:hypothetical protein
MSEDRKPTYEELTELLAASTAARRRIAAETERIIAETELLAPETERIIDETEQLKAQLKSTNKVTLEAFCKLPLFIQDNSESTAHVNTLKEAEIKEVDLPLIDLPHTFWTSCYSAEYRSGRRSAQNEAHVEKFCGQLIDAVGDALVAIGYIDETNLPDVVPRVNVMDVIPDLTIVFGENRYLGATIEVKKHVKGQLRDIFGPNVAGQVFEQLYLSKLGLSGNSYGLISTYNSVRLVSTGSFKDDMKELNGFLDSIGATTSTKTSTPDTKLPASSERLNAISESISSVTNVTKLASGRTRVAAEIEKLDDVPYTIYAMKRADLPDKDDFKNKNEEAVVQNRQVIMTIATFLLLASRSVSAHPRDVSASPLQGPVRVINTRNVKNKKQNGDSSCSMEVVKLPRGIHFNSHPSTHQKFYAWSQLGVGSTGTCCLATVSSGAACVLKFFHHKLHNLQEEAEAERDNWKHIYEEEKWTFIKVYKVNGTVMMVMPYLRPPEDKKERDELLAGDEKSLLWEALKAFADKGKRHADLKWRHVGITIKENKKRKRMNAGETRKQVFLLDLGSVSHLEAKDANAWVANSFKAMKSRYCEQEGGVFGEASGQNTTKSNGAH